MDTLVVVMPQDICPVQWTGRQAVVTLPQHIDGSNVGQIREQLLWITNRGAAVLIVDLTETVSCDYSGADALVRAYHRAVAGGTELELVAMPGVVRRVLSLSGLDRLVSVYPTLEAAIARAERPEASGKSVPAANTLAVPGLADQARAAAQRADRAEEMLDWAVSCIFTVGMSLQAAAELPRDAAAQRITDALCRLDDVLREIRRHVFAERGQQTRRDLAWRPPPGSDERFGLAPRRTALANQRVVQTARALHAAAAYTAALLEQRGDLLGQPGCIDYPAEIKQWQVFADQAAQMAERWEQRP